MVDLTAEEEMCSTSALQVAVDGGGAVCGLTKRRQKGVDPSLALVGASGCYGCVNSIPSLEQPVGSTKYLQLAGLNKYKQLSKSQSMLSHSTLMRACVCAHCFPPSAGDGGGGAAGGGQAARGTGGGAGGAAGAADVRRLMWKSPPPVLRPFRSRHGMSRQQSTARWQTRSSTRWVGQAGRGRCLGKAPRRRRRTRRTPGRSAG